MYQINFQSSSNRYMAKVQTLLITVDAVLNSSDRSTILDSEQRYSIKVSDEKSNKLLSFRFSRGIEDFSSKVRSLLIQHNILNESKPFQLNIEIGNQIYPFINLGDDIYMSADVDYGIVNNLHRSVSVKNLALSF